MPKFSSEFRLGLLVEIAAIILEQLHITAAYIIWPLFILGAALIGDWIFRGEWRDKHGEAALKKRVPIYVTTALISLLALAGWLAYGIKSVNREEAKNTQVSASSPQATPEEHKPSPPPTPAPSKEEKKNRKRAKVSVPEAEPAVTESPKHEPDKQPIPTANPVPAPTPQAPISTGAISQGACSSLQIGGSNNRSTVNCGPPPPGFTLSLEQANTKFNDSLYQTTYILTVQTQLALASLRVRAESPNVAWNDRSCLEVLAIGNGIFSGSARDYSRGPGYCDTHALDIRTGIYQVTVLTTEPETIKMFYNAD